MTPLRPFFPYYGSKWSGTRDGCYPRPAHPRIIEPFAGSACYSLHHHDREVVLIERDRVIAELWRWLIAVDPAEVLALPDLEPRQSTDDLDVCPAARSLIGFWCGISASNNKTASRWALSTDRRKTNRKSGGPELYWSSRPDRIRHRIAEQLPAIRHWTVVEGEAMATTIHGAATWFVDPPYQGRPGSHYRFGSERIDYAELGAWCQCLPGQVIVCEQQGADWLPFEPVGAVNGQRGKSREVAWFSRQEDSPSYRQPGLFGPGA